MNISVLTVYDTDKYLCCIQILLTSRINGVCYGHLVNQRHQAWFLPGDIVGSTPSPGPTALETILTAQKRRSTRHSPKVKIAEPGEYRSQVKSLLLSSSLPFIALVSFVTLFLFPLKILASHLVKHHVEGFVEFPKSVNDIRVNAGMSPTFALA